MEIQLWCTNLQTKIQIQRVNVEIQIQLGSDCLTALTWHVRSTNGIANQSCSKTWCRNVQTNMIKMFKVFKHMVKMFKVFKHVVKMFKFEHHLKCDGKREPDPRDTWMWGWNRLEELVVSLNRFKFNISLGLYYCYSLLLLNTYFHRQILGNLSRNHQKPERGRK